MVLSHYIIVQLICIFPLLKSITCIKRIKFKIKAFQQSTFLFLGTFCEDESSFDNTVVIIIVIVLAALILLILCVSVCLCHYRREAKEPKEKKKTTPKIIGPSWRANYLKFDDIESNKYNGVYN